MTTRFEWWRWLTASPARLVLVVMLLGLGALGWLLLAASQLSGKETPPAIVHSSVRSAAADRTAAVLVDDEADGTSGLVTGSVIDARDEGGVSRIEVRVENHTGQSIPLGTFDFSMPDAAPPVSPADPDAPTSLPAGNALEVWLTFSSASQMLLWCPTARPGTCIRL